MKKQTYVIHVWSGAPTWIEAEKMNYILSNHIYYRATCKKVETALGYLKELVKLYILNGTYSRFFSGRDAKYQVVSTPDGITEEEVVAKGYIGELINRGKRFRAFFTDVVCENGCAHNFYASGNTMEEVVRNLYMSISYEDNYIPESSELEGNRRFHVFDYKAKIYYELEYNVVNFHYIFDKGRTTFDEVYRKDIWKGEGRI